MIPMKDKPDLHYRHAKQENLLLVGPEQNALKNNWLKSQVRTFQYLGWRFVTVDLSNQMGHPHLLGEHWTSLERRAMNTFQNPLIQVKSLSHLADTLEEVAVSIQSFQLPVVTLIHVGSLFLDKDTSRAVCDQVRRLLAYRTGVWLIVPSLETVPLSLTTRHFQTQVLLRQFGGEEDSYWKWIKAMELDPIDPDWDDVEALFVFNGRSEGAKGRWMRARIDEE